MSNPVQFNELLGLFGEVIDVDYRIVALLLGIVLILSTLRLLGRDRNKRAKK